MESASIAVNACSVSQDRTPNDKEIRDVALSYLAASPTGSEWPSSLKWFQRFDSRCRRQPSMAMWEVQLVRLE